MDMGTQNQRFGSTGDIERHRFECQLLVDRKKEIEERRRKGQFSTPYDLAMEISRYGVSMLKESKIMFLEPAFGTGVFYSALSSIVSDSHDILRATGYEIDEDYYQSSIGVWDDYNIRIIKDDFLSSDSALGYNLLLTNPPYVRHHYIDKKRKEELQSAVKNELGIKISGLAGLYCYFVLLAHKWLADKALCGWLLPSEFMDVNYGSAVKEYLLNKVHLVRIHRYDPSNCRFDDALVSSCVVWYKNEVINDDYEIVFSYGGTHDNPDKMCRVKKSQAMNIKKWTHIVDDDYNSVKNVIQDEEPVIGDYFDIKRGLATGDNEFFILSKKQIQENNLDMKFFKPILPSPRNMKNDEVMADDEGNPRVEEQLFLLDCDLAEDEIKQDYPSLWRYLCGGMETTANKYLCKSRKRWYFQEHREPTAFLCSYMGRGKQDRMPFRFILNHSNAIASNSYLLLYPKDDLKERLQEDDLLYQKVWEILQDISVDDIEGEGRVYGGGLKKIEPKELARVKCRNLQQAMVM